jgi:hypothetical protein
MSSKITVTDKGMVYKGKILDFETCETTGGSFDSEVRCNYYFYYRRTGVVACDDIAFVRMLRMNMNIFIRGGGGGGGLGRLMARKLIDLDRISATRTRL